MMNSIWTWIDELDQKLDKRSRITVCSQLSLPVSSYKETLIFTALFGFVIYFLTQPAFDSFIYGEEFISQWLYSIAGDSLFRAIFTPFSAQFFRPSSIAWSLGTELLLPWHVWLFHVRNFLFTVVNLFLLHRVMLRVTSSPLARLLGLTIFAISKVQLTIIGMSSLIANIGALTYFLITLLFLLRYFQGRKIIDYVLALIFSALAFFARDFSVVLIAVIFVLFSFYTWECGEKIKIVVLQFFAFLLIACIYLTVRFTVAAPEVGGAGYYTITIDLQRVWEATWTFFGNLFNLSLLDIYKWATGRGDMSTLLTDNTTINQVYKTGFLILGTLLLAWTTIRGLWYSKWASFSLVWAIVMIGPTFLIRNLQVYYIYEPVAAISVLLAMMTDRNIPGRPMLFGFWVPVMLIVGINGYAHNQNIDYLHWRIHQNRAAIINQDIFMPNREHLVRSLTILTPTQQEADYTNYLLSPFGPPHPMLKILLRPEVSQFQAMSDTSFQVDRKALEPTELVYRYFNPGYAPAFLSRGTCNSFEDEQVRLGTAHVLNTETSTRVQYNPAYASAGSRSIEVIVASSRQVGPHYGGVDLDIPQTDFMIDFAIDRPQHLTAIYVYAVSDEGIPVYGWINEDPGTSLMAEQKLTLIFLPSSKNNYGGFQWQDLGHVDLLPSALQFFVEVKKGRAVTFFLDQLCELESGF